jgi:hypothetical protein
MQGYAVSIIVPSTYKQTKTLTAEQFTLRINRVEKQIARTFGGFTTNLQGEGGWVLENGTLVKENVAIVTTFTTDPRVFAAFEALALVYSERWSQEAVAVYSTPIQYAFVS